MKSVNLIFPGLKLKSSLIMVNFTPGNKGDFVAIRKMR